MHPNALQVDPKIVRANKRFTEESEAAEEAFLNLEEAEINSMHERFVVALGGRVPIGDEQVRQPADRLKQENTFIQTMLLLKEGKTISQIMRVRNLTETTVWGHIERLATDGELELKDVEQLEPTDIDWQNTRTELDQIMKKEGVERLKPIYEAANERYDYNLIRLARLQFALEGNTLDSNQTVF